MNLNMPTMAASAHTHTAYSAAQLYGNAGGISLIDQKANAIANAVNAIPQGAFQMAATRRVVQVIIADPNENIPLEDCLLFKGEEKLTDATDQELFFELDIKDLLEKHNAKRIKVVDKKVKDRTDYLEPAKVRDLKMVVVTVASL